MKYVCEICKKEFAGKSQYNRHKERKQPCKPLSNNEQITNNQIPLVNTNDLNGIVETSETQVNVQNVNHTENVESSNSKLNESQIKLELEQTNKIKDVTGNTNNVSELKNEITKEQYDSVRKVKYQMMQDLMILMMVDYCKSTENAPSTEIIKENKEFLILVYKMQEILNKHQDLLN